MTPSPTPTFIFKLSTPTTKPKPTKASKATPTPAKGKGSGGGSLECQFVSQIPANDTSYSPNTPFIATWTIKNSGTSTWSNTAIDIVYLGGAGGVNLASASAFDMSNSVDPGNLTNISIAMTAPGTSGTYSTYWALRSGGGFFCDEYLKLTIVVP